MAPPSGSTFPKFDDGDVHIIITGSRQFMLHSSILKNISPTMRELLADQWAAKLNSKAIKRGVTGRFRLVMVDNQEEHDLLAYVLEPIPVDEDGKAMGTSTPIGLDLENGVVVEPIVLAYHSVLGAFYGVPIELGDYQTDPMSHIIIKASSVIDVAEYLECVHIITKPIEATLLAMGQHFHQAVANNPVAWLHFAWRIRSRVVFREGLIHATGQYNLPAVQDQIKSLDQAVANVLHKKAKILKSAVQKAELKILSYYPTHLQREKTVGRADKDSIGRASYGNDVMTWIALTFLRHFFAQHVCEDATHNAEDMGFELVTTVVAGGDEYLSKAMLEEFHTLFPMSRKGASVVEAKVTDMKEFIKTFVKDLVKNESQLDIRGTPVKHFTCTTVSFDDYPWHTRAAPMQVDREDSINAQDDHEYDGGDEQSSA